ncbi:MAG TPA: FAD binding domain-containing protein [Actinomycetota bacterium]|nr:FAD binding domain-containing protein [Actinomycetota bacterium]
MFPSRFDYTAPASLDEALTTLGERADETKVLAGGQSLIPLMKLRFAAPRHWSTSIGSQASTSSRRAMDTSE